MIVEGIVVFFILLVDCVIGRDSLRNIFSENLFFKYSSFLFSEPVSKSLRLSISFHWKDDHYLSWTHGLHAFEQLRNQGSCLEAKQWDLSCYWLELYLSKILLHLGQGSLSLHFLTSMRHSLEWKQQQLNDHSTETTEDFLKDWNCTYLARIYYYEGYTYLFLNNQSLALQSFLLSINTCPCWSQSLLAIMQTYANRAPQKSLDVGLVYSAIEQLQLLIDHFQLRARINSDSSSSSHYSLIYEIGDQFICDFPKDIIGRETVEETNLLLQLTQDQSSESTSTAFPHIPPYPWDLQQQFNLYLSTFHWSLFYYYDAINDPIQAWQHLTTARELEVFRLHESPYYRLNNSIEDVHIAKQYYSSDYWPLQPVDWIGLKREKTPIFIVGFFRCGSTLLESLLTTIHPSIHGIGESKLLSTYLGEFQEEIQRKMKESTSFSHPEWSTLLQQTGRKYVAAARRRVQELQSLNTAMQEQANEIFPMQNISQVIRLLKTSSSKKYSPQNLRIINKSLGNYKNIPLIHLLFPEAIIIHLIRDPLDTLLSCLKNRFSDHSPYTLQIEALVTEYISYLEIMAHYRKVLPILDYSTGRRQALIELRYEEIVMNPTGVINRLLSLLEISRMSQETIKTETMASNSPNTVPKTISFLQVQQPLYNRSIGGWRKYANQLQQTLIPVLLPQLHRLASENALPFHSVENGNIMNWLLDPNFDYDSYLQSFESKDIPVPSV